MSIEILTKNKAKLIVSIGSRGNKKRFTKTVTYTGKKDLQKQYQAFEAQVKSGDRPSNLTVPELVEWHIGTLRTLGTKATTLRGYETCQNRINLGFERVLAEECTMYHIERFISQSANKGQSPKTIKNTVSLLSSAYKHAIKSGILKNNPCEGAVFPKQERKEIETLSAAEVTTLMSALESVPLDVAVAVKLALFCGLRMSEVLGLKEENISLDFGVISVKQTRHRVKGKDVIQDTKTKNAQRVIAMPEFLQRNIAELIRNHTDYSISLLILNEFGEPMVPQTLGKWLKRIEKEYDLNEVTFHGLRHTHATMLNALGTDVAQISRQLGHSNISTTLNIYTHVFGGQAESSRRIAQKLEIFEGKEEEKAKK